MKSFTLAIAFFTGSTTILGSYLDFEPPAAISVHEALYPLLSVAEGGVCLLSVVDEEGNIAETKILHTIPSLSDPSVASAKKWKFAPAKLNGRPIPSRASLTFVYDRVFGAASFPPLKQVRIPSPDSYTPPIPMEIRRGMYPPDSTARGTVVLEVGVERGGNVSRARVLHSRSSLDQPSVDAALSWKFKPAEYEGRPIRSSAFIGFVYEPIQTTQKP